MNSKIIICLTLLVLISCNKSHPGRISTVPPPAPEKKVEEIKGDLSLQVESNEVIPFQISQTDYETLRKKLAPTSSEKNFIYFIDTKNGDLSTRKLELTISDFNNKIRILLAKEIDQLSSLKSGCYLSDLNSLVTMLDKPALILKLTKELCTFAADKNVKHPIELLNENILAYRIDPNDLTLVKKQIIRKSYFTLNGKENTLNFTTTSLEKKIINVDLECKLDLSDYANKAQQISICTEDFKQSMLEVIGITVN